MLHLRKAKEHLQLAKTDRDYYRLVTNKAYCILTELLLSITSTYLHNQFYIVKLNLGLTWPITVLTLLNRFYKMKHLKPY